jgi:ABC-2 type transport system permease protein
MRALTQVLSITLKELRELLRRPLLVAMLILGPLAIMVAFGIGSDATFPPPRAIVVVPEGQEKPRLLRDYQREFEHSLSVAEYTSDPEYARRQLRRNRVDAVVILPPAPLETVASGKQAQIRVLYNEINPSQRWLIPEFVRSMASDINREIFLQQARAQQEALRSSSREIDLTLSVLDRAISAAEHGNREEAARLLGQAEAAGERLDDALALLGPEAGPIRAPVARIRARLREGRARLAEAQDRLATPDPRPPTEQLGLDAARRDLANLHQTLDQLTSVPPEVAISPLAVEAEYTARLKPDIIVFFAPAMLALLIQHTAVSLGALSLVRERLALSLQLYMVSPVSNLQLLAGKYLAYLMFTLSITAVLVALLLGPFGVPLFGSPWRMALILVLLALASIGLGFAASLLVATERQAVQFAMLSLLAIVFFGGFALPVESLQQPALALAYSIPATYGADLLQDVMLRGLPGSNLFLLILAALAVCLFAVCLGLLHWRTRPR